MSSVYMIVFTVGLAVQILAAAAASCEEGIIRFYSGMDLRMGPHAGYVEFCYKDEWKILCGGSFNRVEANVICKQLGYLGSTNRGTNTTLRLKPFVIMDPKACNGHESAITECNITQAMRDQSCTNNRWVKCLPDNCTNGSLRLVGGASYKEGRVEVCVDGRWGTVCYHKELAGTVCQQLGFECLGKRPTHTNIPGPKTNCTAIDNKLNCSIFNPQGTCKGLSVECARSYYSDGNCTVVDCPVTETNTDTLSTNELDSVTNKNTAQESINSYIIISLGAVIGLLALLELTTVIGCMTCIARLRGHSHKTREITSISYHKPNSSLTLERDIVVVPNDAVSHATSNEAKQTNNKATGSYETIDTNVTVIEGYEPILPRNEIIADYDTIETARDAVVQYSNTATVKDETIEGYETVDTNNEERGIDGYDYIVSRNSPPPIVPPYQPDTPPPVGGVSGDNTTDYIYAVVDKSRKKKTSQE